ncbi:MAG TPA: cytochrome c biogenesis protein CcsA [Noviherbaspirillum sp.]|uniref:cytochrome c biogenesis protein CcsA n=1 Tax=Noviherbaspirillum sp. TaxID=1926288 RepID=UPI002B49CB4C|nr:cytochrome c biogenesis protein CcsA [Noviherbaspirillum sp.]HJV88653.1 cytochrome c biogenesis protein CcsA [Noviherbaspirillum sp.]
MERQDADNDKGFAAVSATSFWIGVAIAGIVLLGGIEYLETGVLSSGTRIDDLFIFRLSGYANLLLISSTILYVGQLWSTSETIGRWASGLALLGATVSITSLLWRWFETYFLHRVGHVPLDSLYDTMTLLCAVTVLIYLVMERVYRARTAGPFVMLIVLVAVLFQIWLSAHDEAISGNHLHVLKSYWMYAHVLGSIVGYAAYAVAAFMAAGYLARERAESRGQTTGFAMTALPERGFMDDISGKAMLLGFPVFCVATALGLVWLYEVRGGHWMWEPMVTWALFVCLASGLTVCLRLLLKPAAGTAAWWTVVGFGLTILAYTGAQRLSW